MLARALYNDCVKSMSWKKSYKPKWGMQCSILDANNICHMGYNNSTIGPIHYYISSLYDYTTVIQCKMINSFHSINRAHEGLYTPICTSCSILLSLDRPTACSILYLLLFSTLISTGYSNRKPRENKIRMNIKYNSLLWWSLSVDGTQRENFVAETACLCSMVGIWSVTEIVKKINVWVNM